MGSDELFKKKREARRKRKFEFKRPKANSYLIVTEGGKTEPFYLEGIVRLIKQKIGGNVVVDIFGEGRGTLALVERADELVSTANILYQNVWIVFDKDDFSDFDTAIETARSKGYSVAWSNQSFEYWIYLHFRYSDSALHRDDWIQKVSDLFRQHRIGDGVYRKNYKDIYEMLDIDDRVDKAIKNAKTRMVGYNERTVKPSKYDPGTTVHILVEELRDFLKE